MLATIRRYQPDDAATTAEVFQAAIRVTAAEVYTSEQIAAWAGDEVDLPRWAARRIAAWTLVAELDGRVVGFSDLTDDGELDMLFVHPDAGGQGVARQLVASVLDEARRRGLARVTTHASRAARPAFQRFGFVVDAENLDNRIRGVMVPNYDMHVDLVD